MSHPVRLHILARLLPLLVAFAVAHVLVGGEVQAQSAGPVHAAAWNEPPSEADNISELIRTSDWGNEFGFETGQTLAPKSLDRLKGRRYLLPNAFSFYIAHDNFSPDRDNPNDRTIATTLTENISGENRTSITVEALPYDLGDGHELAIQTGDPSNPPLGWDDVTFVYVDGGATAGDTSISIDDGSGNPVTITASQGDRILSKWQSPWFTHAATQMNGWMQDFLNGFTDAGGDLDGVVLDVEIHVGANKAIKHDPRWDDPEFGRNGESLKEILAPMTIDDVIDQQGSNPKWDAEISKAQLAVALNEAIFDPLTNEFPNARGSNYENTGVPKSERTNAPNSDGRLQYRYKIFGTHGSKPLYASIRGLSKRSSRGKIGVRYAYGKSPIATVRYMTKLARTMYRGTDGHVQPWITYPNINDFFQGDLDETPNYYNEYIRHVVLHVDTGVPLLHFNARGASGGGGSDENDINVSNVFQGIRNQLNDDSFTTHTTEEIGWLENPIVTAVEANGRLLWRVTVMRVDPNDSRDITVNVSNGDSFVIPGGEVGAWYESGTNEPNLTFSYTHPPVENLYSSKDWQGLGTGTWDVDFPDAVTYTFDLSDPKGGSRGIKLDNPNTNGANEHFSPEVQLEKNTKYTFSYWAKGAADISVWTPDKSGRLTRLVSKPDGWTQYRQTFETGDFSSVRVLVRLGPTNTFYVALPMINKFENMGPYASPGGGSTTSQVLDLQKGGNLVSTAVQPSDPDLETIFGDAISTLVQVETEDGQVFDPETGTDEIGTWDASAAYKIYAKAPTSFVMEGTALDSISVSLDVGLNWLPYPGSTSVAIDQALESIQNELVMVKDETGRVYRPSQGTTQIDSLKPGAAYKILLETPVTLSYPLQ
ncbi:carbohydrate binding domain-containing protein [Salinibacter altiplanensis]|uniref:carbohydrate binding domain-containing protein n=1 Tax=Salinibacter altiplanensis TaxID=1803181 RepID=UPI000C9F6059|nr:carbohydrate binding domain-containing protein [Salinibacter altiplanensis]